MQSSQSDLERTAGQANSHSQGVQDHMVEQAHFFSSKDDRTNTCKNLFFKKVNNPFILQAGTALLAAIT
jgi:hypothetical protein